MVRYHNTETGNVESILKEGLNPKFAEDPNNITNRVLQDVPMEKKKGLVYVAKKKSTANSVGTQRQRIKEIIEGKRPPIQNLNPEDILGLIGKSKHHKTLKLELDYDDIKRRLADNPELRGAKTADEFWNIMTKSGKPMTKSQSAETFKVLGKGTDVIKGGIDPKYIVGGKGYTKRGLKQVIKYAKNNPARFGKETGKIAAGVGVLGLTAGKVIHDKKKKK